LLSYRINRFDRSTTVTGKILIAVDEVPIGVISAPVLRLQPPPMDKVIIPPKIAEGTTPIKRASHSGKGDRAVYPQRRVVAYPAYRYGGQC
jgi:hypothetical protein